jgi:hypothetical protein
MKTLKAISRDWSNLWLVIWAVEAWAVMTPAERWRITRRMARRKIP